MHVGGHSNWRAAAPTVFVFYFAAIHTNLLQDLSTASTRAQLFHLQKSSDSTQSIAFKSSDSNYSFPFKTRSSGSIRASGLLALVPSGPRALPHPGFVPCPIPGLWLYVYYISFKIQHDPACVLTMCGFESSGLSFYFLLFYFPPSPCDLPVSCYLATSVVRSRSTG